MGNPPNRETSLPMENGKCAQGQHPGPGQGGPKKDVDSWLTMMDAERKGSSDPAGYADGDDS